MKSEEDIMSIINIIYSDKKNVTKIQVFQKFKVEGGTSQTTSCIELLWPYSYSPSDFRKVSELRRFRQT